MTFLNHPTIAVDPAAAVFIWMLVPNDEEFLDHKFRQASGPIAARAARQALLTITPEILDYTGGVSDHVDLLGGKWGGYTLRSAAAHGRDAGIYLLEILNRAFEPTLPIAVRRELGQPKEVRRALHRSDQSATTFETRTWPRYRSVSPLWAARIVLEREYPRGHQGEALPWPTPTTELSDLFDLAEQFERDAQSWAPLRKDSPILRPGEAWYAPPSFPRNPKSKSYKYPGVIPLQT